MKQALETLDKSTFVRKNLHLLIKSAYDNINSFSEEPKTVMTPLLFFSSCATSTGRCSQLVTYSEERGEPLILAANTYESYDRSRKYRHGWR